MCLHLTPMMDIAGAKRWSRLCQLSLFVVPLLFATLSRTCAFSPTPGTEYRLESQNSGDCCWGNKYNNSNQIEVKEITFQGTPNEVYDFTSVGGGYYQIVEQDRNLVLECDPTNPTAVDAPVWAATNTGTASQEWSFSDAGNGYIYITNRQTGDVLTVQGGGLAQGTRIVTDANTGLAYQKWWIDAANFSQVQCIAVSNDYNVASPKKIVLCSNSYLGATVSGTLGGYAVTFNYWSLPSNAPNYNNSGLLWGQYFYVLVDTTIAQSPGVYTVTVSGFPSASFTVNNNAYQLLPDSPLHFNPTGVIGVSDIESGFFAAQREKENQDAMPEYLAGTGGSMTLQPGTTGNLDGGWDDATSIDVEVAQNATALRNLSYALEDALNGSDQTALRNEVAYGAEFFVALQNPNGSFPVSIKPATDSPVTPGPKLLVNVDVGVAAKCVAALAAASRVLQSSNPTLAAQCLTAAKNGWTWVKANPNDYITDSSIYPPGDWTGSADNILNAACELAMTTEATPYTTDAANLFYAGQFNASGDWVARGTPYVRQVSGLHAAIGLARWVQDWRLSDQLHADVWQQITNYYNDVTSQIDTPFGTYDGTLQSYFGENGTYAQMMLTYANLYRALGRSAILGNAHDQYGWLMGDNPFNSSFVIGAGSLNIQPAFNRPRSGSIGEIIPGILANATPGGPLSSGGTDYPLGEGGVGDTSYLPAAMMLLDNETAAPGSVAPVSGHTYRITSINSGDLLEVGSNSTANGGPIDQCRNFGTTFQEWTLTSLGNGYWELADADTGKCLEVSGSSTSPSAYLDQWTYSGSNFQQWAITADGDGSYKFVNRGSGLVADVYGASDSDGALIDQYYDYGAQCQHWTFQLVN
jgi:hypothetical protein